MGLCGVWGEVQRPSGAGSAASPQAAQKGCVKRFLRWTGLSAGGFRGFWRCPYGRIIKKRRPVFISQRGIGKRIAGSGKR